MASYVLAMQNPPDALPVVCGCVAVYHDERGFHGEAAAAEGDGLSPETTMKTIDLLRSLPDPHWTQPEQWLVGLDGLRNDDVRLVGPWTWDAQPREVLHWSINQAGLTPRAVATIRDGHVSPFPSDS